MLLENSLDIKDLLEAEMEQFPQSSKDGFIKVMLAVSCGFYSKNEEICAKTFQLITMLVEEF